MLEYRTARKEELDEIRALCVAKGVDFQKNFEVCFIAIDNGKIVGVCSLKKVYQIEPLVNASGSASAGQILAEKAMACASLVCNEIQAMVRTPEVAEMFERYGLEVTDTNMTIMRKEV